MFKLPTFKRSLAFVSMLASTYLAAVCQVESPRTPDDCPVPDYSRQHESAHACLLIHARTQGTHVHKYRAKEYAFESTTSHKLLINAFPGSMSSSASQAPERPFPEVASAPRTSNHDAGS